MENKGEFFKGLTKEEQEKLKRDKIVKRLSSNHKWECKICGCKSDIYQEDCPNSCEAD